MNGPGDRTDRVTLVLMVLLGCGNLAIAGVDFALGEIWSGITLAAFGFIWINFFSIRRSWLRIGYMRGRRSMFVSLDEALRRGLTMHQWAAAEMEREVVDLGAAIPKYKDP